MGLAEEMVKVGLSQAAAALEKPMRYYNYALVKQLIDDAASVVGSNPLVDASLGMAEDWYWTAQTVWDIYDGFQVDTTVPYLKLGGVDGSIWATPTLELTWADGTTTKQEVWHHESPTQLLIASVVFDPPLKQLEAPKD